MSIRHAIATYVIDPRLFRKVGDLNTEVKTVLRQVVQPMINKASELKRPTDGADNCKGRTTLKKYSAIVGIADIVYIK